RADYLARSMDLSWVRLRRGEFARLPSPEEATAYDYTPFDLAVVRNQRELAIVGTPETVRERIEAMVRDTGADEIMISSMIHSHEERMRSYELVAEALL